MILADTSIWIDYFRSGKSDLCKRLEREMVCMHPFVIGEIACGTLRDRKENIAFMGDLPQIMKVSDTEALHFLEEQRLMGRGIGYIDLHLLASVALGDNLLLWTRDQRLHAAAADLELAYHAT